MFNNKLKDTFKIRKTNKSMSKYRHISQFNKPIAITTFQGINKHSPGCEETLFLTIAL